MKCDAIIAVLNQNLPLLVQIAEAQHWILKGMAPRKSLKNYKKFYQKRISKRFDQESTRKKSEHKRIIEGFKTGNVDILVGTQLLAKGL